jgi:hypothetical protein
MINSTDQTPKTPNNTTLINVTGYAQEVQRTDVFCISVELSATHSLADRAFTKLNQRVQGLKKAMDEIGMSSSCTIGNVELVQRTRQIQKAQPVSTTKGRKKPPEPKPPVSRRYFVASISYTIECPCDLPTMSKALGGVGGLGRGLQFSTRFGVKSSTQSPKNLVQRAANDALQRAQGIAEAAGTRVKRLVSATDSLARGRGYWAGLEDPKSLTAGLAADFDFVGQPGRDVVTESACVHCVFELEQPHE